MFLMFCEDEAGLIPQNAFRNYVQHFPADYLRNALRDLFEPPRTAASAASGQTAVVAALSR